MSGAGVGEGESVRIEYAVAEGNKFVGGDVVADHVVQFADHRAWRYWLRGEGPEAGLQIGHQKRGADPFSNHVADAYADLRISKFDDIEVIATDDGGRIPSTGNVEAPDLRDLFGQQALLNLARLIEILFLFLRLRLSELECALQLAAGVFEVCAREIV